MSITTVPQPADRRRIADERVDGFFRRLVAENREKEADRTVKTKPPIVLQDHTPLVSSLESELAGVYWDTVGIQAFAGNEVPFIINNDGRLSQDAAAVFFANCLETGAPEERIRILELGAGTGLFALYFLDAFQMICAVEHKDFYDRLTYHVSDGSPRTIEQWQQVGQFDRHTGHVIVGRCDARHPVALQAAGGEVVDLKGLRAVFTNYILDVLPAAVVRSDNGQAQQLCVRTILDDETDLARLEGQLDADAVQRLAASTDPSERVKLLPLLDVLRFDTAFVPIEGDIPYLHEALEFGKDMRRILLNFGALNCLRTCLDGLQDDGLVLINDYGPTREEEVAKFGTATRFGSSIATGVNFPFVEHNLAGRARIQSPPGDDNRSLHSRMLTKTELPQTSQSFVENFSADNPHYENESGILSRARKAAVTGKQSDALELFRQCLQQNPGNWWIMGEVAEYLTRSGDPQSGVNLASMAIERNPWYSSWLWNTLGDGFWAMNQFPDAQRAYEQAAAVNPADVVANFNLSFVYGRGGRHRDALNALSKALSHDFNGEYRERITEQQQQIMRLLSTRWTVQQLRRYQRAAAFE